MEITDSQIQEALGNGDVTEPIIKGNVTNEQIEEARRLSLGETPESISRLGESTVGHVRPDQYDFQRRSYADNNELRANQFGSLKSFGAGLGKLVSNTVFDTLIGASNVLVGVPSAIINGDANEIFDNALSAGLDDAKNYINEETFPIYNSVKDQDKNIINRALTDLEFWTDDIIGEGIPFILSAWLTAYAGTAALGPLTKAKYLKSIQAARGLGATETAAIAKNLAEAEKITAAFTARTVEGLVESKDTRDMVYNKLIQRGENPEIASKEAAKAAMATFGLNYLLLPIEYIQAGSWFKTFSKSRSGLLNASKKGFEVPKRMTLNRFAKEAGTNVVTEGPIEENFQKAIQDYMYERFTGNNRNEIKPWETELREGFSELFSKMGENFTTKEGWDAIGTGSILGGLFGGAATLFGSKAKQEKERLNQLKGDIDLFNANKDKVNERIDNIIEHVSGYENLDKISQTQMYNNNQFNWNVVESLKFGEYAFAHFEAGLGERIEQQIDQIASLSDSDFLSGYKDENKVTDLKSKAVRYEQLYNMISNRFRLQDTKEGKRIRQSLFREAILQEELGKEITQASPRLEAMENVLTQGSNYRKLTYQSNKLKRKNKDLRSTIEDIKNTEDNYWYKYFGHDLTKRLEKEVFNNEREIGRILSDRDSIEKDYPVGQKINKVLEDEYKMMENHLNQLEAALSTSLNRYDLLANPVTQSTVSSVIEESAKSNKETQDTLKQVEETQQKQEAATTAATKTKQPVEKILNTKAELGDTVDGTYTDEAGTVINSSGIVSKVDAEGNVQSVTMDGNEVPISQLKGVVVTAKAGESVSTDLTGNTDPEPEVSNPEDELIDQPQLFEDRNKKTDEYTLAGRDINYTKVGDTFIDEYDANGKLSRNQEEFYNYVNDPNVDLKGQVVDLKLINDISTDEAHIQATLPNGLVTSIHTVSYLENDNIAFKNFKGEPADETEIKKRIEDYRNWRKSVVEKLRKNEKVEINITSKGNGILLRNQKIGGIRVRRSISSLLDINKTPIGISIASKKQEEHVIRMYDWKGVPNPPVHELYGKGIPGRVYVGIPSANGTLTHVPVWARNITENEARLVIHGIIKQLEGSRNEIIPGAPWTYNDLIRFYIYPSSAIKEFDVFMSEQDKTLRVGSNMFSLESIKTNPEPVVQALMSKVHQVQNKRLSSNEEVPVFELINGQPIVKDLIRYRDYLFNSVLETDMQPIEIGDKKLFFGQPTIAFNTEAPVQTKAPESTKEKEDSDIKDILSSLDDDIWAAAGFKTIESPQEIDTRVTEKELTWYETEMPHIPIQVFKDLIQVEALGGQYAVGLFHKAMISIYENAPSGTLYHESFHAVFRMFLTDSERAAITKEYTEEELANLFEQYMLSNGEIKVKPKTQGFFQRLWNIIKAFILGTTNINDIFRSIRTGRYRFYEVDNTKEYGFAPKLYNLNPQEEADLMNYLTRGFFGGIFKEDSFNFNDIESIGLTNEKVLNIYNNIKNLLSKARDVATGDLKSKYSHIIDKFPEIVKAHQIWMSKYKIEPPDIEYNPEEENLKLKDSYQYKEPTEFSAKDNSNFMVKLFIASLPGNKPSSLSLPGVTDYNETWNFLLEKLSGISSVQEITTRLTPYIDVKPELKALLNIINRPNTIVGDIFVTKFMQAFSKFNTRPVTNLLTKVGAGIKAFTVNSENESLPVIIKNEWQNNLFSTNYVEIDPLSQEDNYITKNKLIESDAATSMTTINKSKNSIDTIKEELSKFGIIFTPNAIESWIRTNDANKFISSSKYILTRLANPDLKDKLEIFKAKDEITNINLLAAIEAEYNPGLFEAVHLNPENKPTYHYIQHNFLSLIINQAENGDMKYVSDVLNSYSGASSKWAQAILNGARPKIRLIEGTRLEEFKGKVTTDLDPGMWITSRINGVLQDKPIFPILRPAEKKSEYGLEGFQIVKSGVVRNKSNTGLLAVDIINSSLIDQFYGYFEDEYKRTAYIHLKEKKRNNEIIPEGLLVYMGLSESDIDTSRISPIDTRGRELTFFSRILPKELVDKLMNFHKPTEEERIQIRTAIKTFLVNEINNTFDYLNDLSVIQVTDKGRNYSSRTEKYKEIKQDGTSINVRNVSIGVDQLLKYANDPFSAIADFAVNELVSTFELVKLTMGDVAYYKDFFKRTPLVTGTGKTPRVDSIISKWIQPEYSKLRSKYPLTKSREEIEEGILKLSVVASPHKRSSALSDMRKQLKALKYSDEEITEMTEDYENYDEADAFSWITPQAAREFLLRIGDWDPSLESVYDNIVNGRPVQYKALKHYMTAIKLMGAGPIKTTDSKLNPIAYLKTATLPIIPLAVKGTNLEILLERMYKSGTDMVIVDSGSKGASYEVGDFYDEEGSIAEANLVNSSMNFKYVKLQIDVQQKSKSKVVFGTQLRKLMWSHVFEYDSKGNLINKKFNINGETLNTKELFKRFNEKFSKLTEIYRNNILNELGINILDFENGVYKIADYTKVVSKLRTEAEKRFYPKSYIDAIRVNDDGTGLDIPGDAFINRKSIENLLNALVFDAVVRQKMFGTTSVQIPVTGFESPSIKTKTDSTGELKFLSYDSKEGKVLEAEIYLPHNFRDKAGYLNNLTIDNVDEGVLKLIGFRIPTEGLRSVIKLKIKGFLPREYGDIVVVPSELVAQAGSDFDIDKLQLLQPNYEFNDGRVTKVNSLLETKEGYENYILDITDALLSHKDAFAPTVRTTSSTVNKLKTLASSIRNLKGDLVREDNPLSILSFRDKMEIAYKFNTGKKGVGVAAIHNAHHVLTKYSKLTLNEVISNEINFKHNKLDNKSILYGSKDITGDYSIFDILAAGVNGFVDIVKDPFIIDLFTDLNTASIAFTMVRLGGNVNWIAKFINQPLVQRYIKNKEFSRSEIAGLSGTRSNTLKELRSAYYSRLSREAKALVDTDTWDLKAPIYKNISEVQLDKYMRLAYNNGVVTDTEADIQNNDLNVSADEYYLSQLSILSDFVKYDELSSKISLLYSISNADTFNGKTFNNVDRYVNRKEQQYIGEEETLDKYFENFREIFDQDGDTFIETLYKNGAKVAHKAFKDIFPIRQSNGVQEAVRTVSALVGRTNRLKDYEIEKISDSLMGYIMYNDISKDEMRDFVLDIYATPENRILMSTNMKKNIIQGLTNRFIKKSNMYKVGDKLNLNGVYSLEITKVYQSVPSKIKGNDLLMLGIKNYDPKKPVFVYNVSVVKNKLVKESTIRRIHKLQKETDNVFLKNLKVQFSRKANGINVLKFRARPTDNVVHETIVDSWRELFNSPDPDIRKLASDIAKYAIYQSGMKQSNISFFKYIPPEEFSNLIHNSLDTFNGNLNESEVLNVILRNLWKNNVFVPKIHFQDQVVPVRSGNDLVGYILKKGLKSNANFFNRGVPPFLKIAPDERFPNDYNLLELVGFTNPDQSGNAVYQIVSKLGDGTVLSEYHDGPSIYEDNNVYMEDNSRLIEITQSSANYWTASKPITKEALEESIGYQSTTYSEMESETTNQDIDDLGLSGDEAQDLGDYFADNWQLSADSRPPDKNLDNLLKSILADAGVEVIEVDRILSKHSPVAVAKMLDRSIEVVKNRAGITTLPEEAAHIFFAMLKGPLKDKMLREISNYDVYNTVVSEYSEAYNGDENLLRTEAVGKLIANIIVGEVVDSRAKGWFDRVWEIIKKILAKLNITKLKEYTSNDPNIFKNFAMDILNRKTNKTFSEVIVSNNIDAILYQLESKGIINKEC